MIDALGMAARAAELYMVRPYAWRDPVVLLVVEWAHIGAIEVTQFDVYELLAVVREGKKHGR